MSLEPNSRSSDRRTEPRRAAEGAIELRPQGFTPSSFAAEMVDINSGGFRASHRFQALTSGHLVDFKYGTVEGSARVVWTRILSDRVESGFLILPASGR